MRNRIGFVIITLLFAAHISFGDMIIETAAQPSYSLLGGALINGTQWMGVDFSLGSDTRITDIGADFTNSSTKSIFGAILSVPGGGLTRESLANWKTDIQSLALAHVLFTVPVSGAVVDVPLSVQLSAGNYALVFGSGAWGTTGSAILAQCCTTKAGVTEIMFKATNTPYEASDLKAYMFVKGDPLAPVPEPGSILLVGTMLVGLGFSRKRIRQ